MPILEPTNQSGRVDAVLINADGERDLTTSRLDQVMVTYAGFEGDCHSGLIRHSCVRVKLQYPEGTEIRNTRQISILSSEELAEIGEALDLGEPVKPEWVGANLALSGIPKLTELPPSSRPIFDGGASLVVDMENGPCRYPGDIIERHHPGKGRWFAKHARNKRGVTAWVEKEGVIKTGETVHLHIPPQRLYSPASG
ncbi:MAG: MOSC domain-containing protein [Alphaproteobacteria bacterium]|nr:MOSC domain-containing protein [Alphaproteobacteria bacterium]